ncbi:MAG: hypothetical protein KAR47_18890, partial [Planctomycetes bacterium]|nr:hypothetical protein [Planctomycetota bacterium]
FLCYFARQLCFWLEKLEELSIPATSQPNATNQPFKNLKYTISNLKSKTPLVFAHICADLLRFAEICELCTRNVEQSELHPSTFNNSLLL